MQSARYCVFLKTCIHLNKRTFPNYLLQAFNFPACTRTFHFSPALSIDDKLITAQQITETLRANEFTKDFKDENCPVKSYDSNQLRSNVPIEDTRWEGKCFLTGGILMGIFDGHYGPACAQVIGRRLFDYICVSLAPHDLLGQYCNSLEGGQPVTLIEKYYETYELVPELEALHRKSFLRYVKKLLSEKKENVNVEQALQKAIVSLDEDISNEALQNNEKAMSVAIAGAVACVVYINGSDLHVANVGDCRAVLGQLSKKNTWVAKQLTRDHDIRNVHERARIIKEHPASETDTVFQNGRLLAELAPLRAFGDVRYKWSKEELERLVAPLNRDRRMIPDHYYTPPYLTAKPEVSHHRLTFRDKFLIIGSDGLWHKMKSSQAVQLVGNHIRGKKVLDPLKLPKSDLKLKEINKILQQRKKCFGTRPVDRNAATHLIRKALGGSNDAVELKNLNFMLTLSEEWARDFRDDITVTVVYFDSDLSLHFLTRC